MKEETAEPKHAAQTIQSELSTLRLRADAAARSANVLMHLILAHKTALVSDATILHEIAALLQHSAQNFQQVYSSATRCPSQEQAHPFIRSKGDES
jgi:hypothetical protein